MESESKFNGTVMKSGTVAWTISTLLMRTLTMVELSREIVRSNSRPPSEYPRELEASPANMPLPPPYPLVVRVRAPSLVDDPKNEMVTEKDMKMEMDPDMVIRVRRSHVLLPKGWDAELKPMIRGEGNVKKTVREGPPAQ